MALMKYSDYCGACLANVQIEYMVILFGQTSLIFYKRTVISLMQRKGQRHTKTKTLKMYNNKRKLLFGKEQAERCWV